MRRKIFIVVVSVVGLSLAGVLGVEGWLRHSIRGAVEKALVGTGATVEIGRVGVSLPRQTVSVRNVKIRAQGNDTARRGYTVVSLEAAFPRVDLRGVGFSGGVLRASRLVVSSPSVALVTEMVSGSKEPPGPADNPPREANRPHGGVAGLKIGGVEVSRAALEHTHWLSTDEHTRTVVGGLAITARDIALDLTRGAGLDPLPAAITLRADSLVRHLAGGAQTLRADSLDIDAARGALTLKSFALAPQFPKHEYARLSPRHDDWTEIILSGIACRGVDFARLASAADRALSIDSMTLASARVASFKDRKVHHPARHKQMLHEAIQSLPLPVDIAKLTFARLDLTYEELSENGDAPGVVTLTEARGHATNITNVSTGNDRFMTLDVEGTFMHDGALEARFLFPVSATDDHWELTGRLGPTDMAAFNSALEPLMNARISSGEIQSVEFRIDGTATRSHSSLAMAYRDLSVEILKPHDHTHIRKLLTVLADDLLIRPDNPGARDRGRLRETTGEHTRDPERSMWNYIWHSFLPAFINVII
jgi:hypothetical protein